MRILIVGGGGREHALAWKLAQSPRVTDLHAAPGNAGMAQLGACHGVAAADLDGQVELARRVRPDLVVVAPDDPLAMGLVDRLAAAGFPAFGPGAAAAQIEASKAFAKEVMAAAGVPTAAYATFSEAAAAAAHVRALGGPCVVKADGLALGKGVFVCDDAEQAVAAVHSIMVERSLGEAGARVVVEERLEGPECSVLCITDGEHLVTLPAIQDHKRIGEGDTGPNTGGMGTYAPVPGFDAELAGTVRERVIAPVLAELRRRGAPFRGCLYAGLMLTSAGVKVLEFNARFGDPEAQVAVAMLDEDLLALMESSISGTLTTRAARWRSGACACVVAASGGYPGNYEKGKPITGLEDAETTGSLVFHAGTALRNGEVVTAGGRVLGAVGRGPELSAALAQAYAGLDCIRFDGIYYRRDIGWRFLRG